MNTKTHPNWTRYIPYGCALVSIPIAYLVALVLSRQEMLTACLTAVGAGGVFLLCRMIQRRGQVSLVTTAVVLPLLAAGACSVLLHLNPYLETQRSFQSLHQNGVGFAARNPDQSGEWVRNRSGEMLPVWLASLVGSECLCELSAIKSSLSGLQSADYRSLNVTYLNKVVLSQGSDAARVSQDLVDWLSACPDLNSIYITLQSFTQDDGAALATLDSRNCSLTIHNCQNAAPLDALQGLAWLGLSGDSLSVQQCEQVTKIQDLKALTLNVTTMTDDAIAALEPTAKNMHIWFDNPTTDNHIQSLARLGCFALSLERVESVPALGQDPAADMPVTQHLRINDSDLTIEQCAELAGHFSCTTIQLINVGIPLVGREESAPIDPEVALEPARIPFTADQINQLWQAPNLAAVSVYDDFGWHHYDRSQTGD